MENRAPVRDTSPWRLRAVLALCLVSLVAVGTTLTHRERGAGAPTTSTSGPASTTTTATGATTTTVPVPPGGPIVNVGDLDQTARGCGLVARRPGGLVTTTTLHRVSGIGHCTVVEIGDSLGADLGWGLARELERTPAMRLIELDKSSSGLAATWFYSWPVELRRALRRYHPNLVLVMIGGNDQQGIRVHGSSTVFSTPAWDAAYRARVHDVVSEATKAGAYVFWVGLPVMEPPVYNAGARHLDTLYAQEVPATPGATFLPTWDLLATASGAFRPTARIDHAVWTLRAADGIHFSVMGEDVLATYVTRELAAVYGVPLRPAAPYVIAG